jgi:hypothetical protein
MPVDAVLKILIGSQAGLLLLFIWHLFKCRDTRVDIAGIRGSIEGIAKDIARIGPRTHDAYNAAMSAKAEVERLGDRVERIERHEDMDRKEGG